MLRSKKSQTPRSKEIAQWAMKKSKSKEKIELTTRELDRP